MSETYFKPIINDINELDKNPLLIKSTENDERSCAITPGGIKNITNTLSHGRMDWTEFCSDSDSDDEDESEETEQKSDFEDESEETEKKSDFKDESEETASEQLKKYYELFSSFLDKSIINIDNDFCIKITILFLNLSGFKFQIVEFKDFILKKFFESKNIDINSLNKGGKNSIIKGNNLHYFNEILKLVKLAKPIPCKKHYVNEFINFIFNITEDDELYRHSIKKSFDIENCRILLMTLGKEIPRNPIKLNEKGQKIPLEIVKMVKLADTGINIATENSEGPDAFPYTEEFNKLKKILNSVIENDINLAIIVSIYYQIKDDLEKIVEKANLEYSENK